MMIKTLNNLRGKYIKQLLTKLEALHVLTPEVRKCILDDINELMRDIEKEYHGSEDTN